MTFFPYYQAQGAFLYSGFTLFAGGHGAGEAGHLPQPRGVRGEELTGGLGLGLLPGPGGLHQGSQRVGGLQERVADLAEFTMVTCDFK